MQNSNQRWREFLQQSQGSSSNKTMKTVPDILRQAQQQRLDPASQSATAGG